MWNVLILILALSSSPIAIDPAAGAETAQDPVVVTMTAKKYEFNPSTVTVTKGRPVKLEITALDRTHGFEIKEFNVKVKLEKGKVTVVEFTPDRAGEFEMKCSNFCGFGHGRMKGKFIVTE